MEGNGNGHTPPLFLERHILSVTEDTLKIWRNRCEGEIARLEREIVRRREGIARIDAEFVRRSAEKKERLARSRKG